MYKDIEIETSYKYLRIVLSELKEPVCILGGWAIFFTVNSNYKKQMARVYIGSRDIDIGFNSISSLKQTASILENRLKFRLKKYDDFFRYALMYVPIVKDKNFDSGTIIIHNGSGPFKFKNYSPKDHVLTF